MKLSTNAKLVLVVLIVGAAIYGLFKFYPSKSNTATTITDSLGVVKVESIKPVESVKEIDTIQVSVPVVKKTIKKKEVVKQTTTPIKTIKKKVVKSENDNDQGNDFVPSY